MLEIDSRTISEGGNPYEKFLDGIKNDKTLRNYAKNLKHFLEEIPNSTASTVSRTS